MTVARPIQRKLVDYWDFTGRLAAVEEVEVRTRVRGFLQKIAFREGTEVKAGDLLYEIDPRTFRADVAKAEAELHRQRAQLDLAVAEAKRSELLRARGAVSQEELQERLASRETARAAVQGAEAALEAARLELEFTQIRSPIDGRVSRTRVTEGNLVGFNEQTLLTTVVRLDPIYVYFEASERDYLEYQRMIRERGASTAEEATIPVFVRLTTDEDFPHEGVIDFRDNRVDPATGTIELRGKLPNKDRRLTPGLYARVRVPIGAPQPRLLVPEVALSADQRGQFVLVVADDGTVEARTVEPGRAVEGGLIIVERGIGPGDRIVVNNLQRAVPGSKVRPREEHSTPAAGPRSPGGTPGAGTGPTPRADQVPATAPAIGRPPATAPTGSAPQS